MMKVTSRVILRGLVMRVDLLKCIGKTQCTVDTNNGEITALIKLFLFVEIIVTDVYSTLSREIHEYAMSKLNLEWNGSVEMCQSVEADLASAFDLTPKYL